MKRGSRRRSGGHPSRSKRRIVAAESSLRGLNRPAQVGRTRVSTKTKAPSGWTSKGSIVMQSTSVKKAWRR